MKGQGDRPAFGVRFTKGAGGPLQKEIQMKIKRVLAGAILGAAASALAAQSITFPIGEGEAWLGATMGVGSNVFQMNHEMRASQSRPPHYYSWFTDLSLSDFKVMVGYDSAFAGGKVTVRGPASWGTKTDFTAHEIFSDSYAWVRLGDYVKVQGGWYEYRRMNGLNDYVGNFNYGYISAPVAASSGNTGSLKEVDLFQNLIAEFYIPAGITRVTVEFSPITINKVAVGGSNSATFNEIMQNPDVFAFAGGFRISAPFLEDRLKVQLMYAPAVDNTAGVYEGDPTVDKPKTFAYQGVFNAGAEVYLVEDVEMAFMFSGAHSLTKREWVEEGAQKGDKTLSDVYWAWDARARYTGLPKTTLEAHLKGTFAHDLGRTVGSTATTASFGGFWGAVGGCYQLTDQLGLRLVTDVRYTNRWLEEARDQAIRFEFKPAVRYNLTDKIYAQAGITYALRHGWGTTEEGETQEETIAQDLAIPVSIFIEL